MSKTSDLSRSLLWEREAHIIAHGALGGPTNLEVALDTRVGQFWASARHNKAEPQNSQPKLSRATTLTLSYRQAKGGSCSWPFASMFPNKDDEPTHNQPRDRDRFRFKMGFDASRRSQKSG